MCRLIVAIPSRRTTNRPWKGRGYVTWHILNFGCPIHISGMAEARALNFFTKGDYIKSCRKNDKSPLKGAWFFWGDPLLSAQLLTSKKFCRHTLLAGINKIDDGPPCLSRLRQSNDTLRHKLHRFDFSPCLLQTCLYNIWTTNRSSGVWALSFKYAVRTDISVA